jgi:hypothetical protein
MAIKKSDLYSSLWASCDELRGGMDANQYKDYVLFVLFIKYVTDKYGNSTDFAPPVTIPAGASFKDMLELRGHGGSEQARRDREGKRRGRDHHREQALGPGLRERSLGRVERDPAPPAVLTVAGHGSQRTLRRQRCRARPAGLAPVFRRPDHAGLVPDRRRRADRAHVFDGHGRHRALHARGLRPVQRAARDQTAVTRCL